MLRIEANEIIGRELSEAEFQKLNMIYMCNPMITTQQELAKLYEIGGWCMLDLLIPLAKKVADLEQRKADLKAEIKVIEQEILDIEREVLE